MERKLQFRRIKSIFYRHTSILNIFSDYFDLFWTIARDRRTRWMSTRVHMHVFGRRTFFKHTQDEMKIWILELRMVQVLNESWRWQILEVRPGAGPPETLLVPPLSPNYFTDFRNRHLIWLSRRSYCFINIQEYFGCHEIIISDKPKNLQVHHNNFLLYPKTP